MESNKYLLTYKAYLEYSIEGETFEEYSDRIYLEKELKDLNDFEEHYYKDKL